MIFDVAHKCLPTLGMYLGTKPLSSALFMIPSSTTKDIAFSGYLIHDHNCVRPEVTQKLHILVPDIAFYIAIMICIGVIFRETIPFIQKLNGP